MSSPAYPIARSVAPRIAGHLKEHLDEERVAGNRAVLPDPPAAHIEAIISAGFWASLRREEGYSPTISLALVPPSCASNGMTFERPIPLAPEPLTRLAPAVERPGIHLGVWEQEQRLAVWGATRSLPLYTFVLEVLAPGLLVVKHSRGEDRKFANLAVLEGDQIKVVDHQAARKPGAPKVLAALFGLDLPGAVPHSLNPLVQLAISIRAHPHGGTLLMVPSGSTSWAESLVHPVRYSVSPAFSRLAELVKEPEDDQHDRWVASFRKTIDGVAGLTAVDGATVISDDFSLLAFGAMIARHNGGEQVDHVRLVEPFEGSVPLVISTAQLGGTRHLSAAQFVNDQRDSTAFVASQDGRFTIFTWSEEQKIVQAHRVESLLL